MYLKINVLLIVMLSSLVDVCQHFRVVGPAHSFEMSVNIYQTMQHHTLEDIILYGHCCVNLKSKIFLFN
jgi:hypothetical protein